MLTFKHNFVNRTSNDYSSCFRGISLLSLLSRIFACAAITATAPLGAQAGWNPDPTQNTPICTAVGSQYNVKSISDGAGGYIAVWTDYRNGNNDVYAQRIDANGNALWQADGAAVCTAGDAQLDPELVSDGSGGAIITWRDYRSGHTDIYAQRLIGATGAPAWTANGVVVCGAANNQSGPKLAGDGSGGAIITWYDYRSGSSYDIYAQKLIPATGAPAWTADGVAVSTSINNQLDPQIINDGSGGAIVTWHDNENDIKAQKLRAATGAPAWTANGVLVCSAPNLQTKPQLIGDGSGGAIVTWNDYRSGNPDIYAQKLIPATGAPAWTVNGVAVCSASGSQAAPQLVGDGSGSAIIAWHDRRSGSSDIYAQKLLPATGASAWTGNGVAVCTAVSDQYNPQIISDGSGGAIITWYDYRSGDSDVYAQKLVGATGAPAWAGDGVAVCTAENSQHGPQLVSDGFGAAIITWNDYRSGSNHDIYASRLGSDGSLVEGQQSLMRWNPDPAQSTRVSAAIGSQKQVQLVSDGGGGAIYVWIDHRNGNWDIYAQRFDANGNALWQADGVPVCTAANEQSTPKLTGDGSGGVIITWYDLRSGNGDIYAQKLVTATGASAWSANGVAVCTAANTQSNPQLIGDGSGGAIITWQDTRSGILDIYAQKLFAATGAPGWVANGVAVCTAANQQSIPQLTSDGSGGAIITWYDLRSGNGDIYAQKLVAATGAPAWTANGVAVCTAANSQYAPQLAGDGSGGAIITWYEHRNGPYGDIYAQKLMPATGAAAWTGNGVAVCTAANHQSHPRLVSDASGGAIIAWLDYRNGNYDIYAQKLLATTGAPAWIDNGVAVSTAANDKNEPFLTSDGVGGAIIAWQDYRSGTYDIYASRVGIDGSLVGGQQILAPADVTISAAPDGLSLQLSWADNATNETNYKLLRSQNGSEPALVATLPADSTSYTDEDVDKCSIYEYTVVAYNASNEGAAEPVDFDNRHNPTITLTGPATVDIAYGETYTDAGATAEDACGVELTPTVTENTVNTNAIGSYSVAYSVTDARGKTDSKTRTVNVVKAEQTITFGELADKVYGDGPITLSASSSSELPVSLAVSGPASLSGTELAITGVGTVTVTASQAGSENYNAATDVVRSFQVAKADQTITFAEITDKTYGDGPISLSASSSSELPVSLAVSGPASLSGTELTITGVGTVTVTASQPGNENYNAAADVVRSFEVAKASQTITFAEITDKTYGDGPITLSASSSSELPVSYSVDGPATLEGAILTITGAGTVTVTATADGDENHNAAEDVVRTFTVNKANAAISVIGYTGTYDGLPHTATGTASGIESTPADLTSLLTITGTFTQPPGGTANWSFAGNDNYKAASGSVAITINPHTPIRPKPPVRP